MTPNAIEINGVSKLYRLGEVGTGTLSHDLNRWWHKVRGKEDPYMKLGQENKRDSSGGEYVWALKDVNFNVQQGDIVGIVGKNGAGKSTLLKLLSRVTSPSRGLIRAKGRVASLLEVGTGFHPELTGRENIFLNGAILGMTKQEIRRKFDEIVDFAGIARYVDTPVKRYSSGMYVRLAFGVAAHLESEILIVDEVLAVGDAEFQNKCLGKMSQVSKGEGRTVLFVSHNMAAVKTLCRSGILMERGTVKHVGTSAEVIEEYLKSGSENDRCVSWIANERPGDEQIRIDSISILDEKGSFDNSITSDQAIGVEIRYEVLKSVRGLRIVANLLSFDGVEIFTISDYSYQGADNLREPGKYVSSFRIPSNTLNSMRYHIAIDIEIPKVKSIVLNQIVSFNVDELINNQLGITLSSRPTGFIHPVYPWSVKKI